METEVGRKLLVTTGVESLLRDLIHERTGIFFEVDRLETLVEKVEPLALARGNHSLLDYYYLLKYESNGVEDWINVMDALSVQETYFWRETPQIEALVESFVPNWFKKTELPLRIWSAGSASGEEPYSIAIALMEAGWGNHPIEILASDGSPSALLKSRAAIYRERSFRCLPLALKEKYFTPVEAAWKLRPEIAQRVGFRRANLLATEEIASLARSPVIFCRNVFIYFSQHAIRQTVAAFASYMPSGGHLFVGASESLLKMTADFELRDTGNAFVYVRI
jgi:chemotaxis protein methyltransferase CheR